jgi:hypothetical protein
MMGSAKELDIIFEIFCISLLPLLRLRIYSFGATSDIYLIDVEIRILIGRIFKA